MVAVRLSFTGEDATALFRAVAKERLFGFPEVGTWTIDSEEHSLGPEWREVVPAQTKDSAQATFGSGAEQRLLVFDSRVCVKVQFPWNRNVGDLVDVIGRLPCTLVAVSTLFPEWNSDQDLKLPNKMFGYAHDPYRAFAAFKGAGHERLVSRRWLSHGGPWELHRDEQHDVSLLQLHDLDADSKTANMQVRRCQERLGPSDSGGYIAPGLTRKLTLDIQHSEKYRRASIVVAPGREVTPREMLEARTLRGSNVAGPDRHIDSVAFIYIDEPDARRDLHELWLRGLECWTYVNGREVRIDDTYEPPPAKPPW